MTESERRELELPSENFDFTKDGQLVVKSERLTKAFRESGMEPGVANEAFTITISVSIKI